MEKKYPNPPRLAEKILSRMRRGGEEFSFLGDMREEYAHIHRERGVRGAKSWYRRQILINLPAYMKDSLYWSCQMFKNYFVITLRNIKRNKGFSFINITGLAIGMSACLLILLWVRDELSFNGFHRNVENIYLVVSERVNHRGEFFQTTPVPLAEPLENDYPEIAKVVRFQFRSELIARHGENIFNDWKGAYVDPEVFDVFTFPFSKGDPKFAFLDVNSIVLTETAAQKLFAGIDPVGQMMEIEGDLVKVAGILRDIPKNSDIQVDFLRPFQSMKELTRFRRFIWNWFACSTYVQIEDGVDPATINPKIADLLNTNRPWSDDPLRVFLYPFADYHLHKIGGGGPIKYVFIFTIVALLILVIACINFMNLSTARSAKRAREVGLRKVVGSKRLQLIKQFFLESTFFTVLSAIIAILLARLFMPLFNQLAGKQLQINLTDTGLLVGIVGMAIFTGFVAGFYPALILSSFQPIDVLKGNFLLQKVSRKNTSVTGTRFRQVMVLTQFVLSIGLIVCALLVFRQLEYMKNADLGFDKDNLVRVSIPEKYRDNYGILKADFAQSPNIISVSASSSENHGGSIDWDGASGDMQYLGTNTKYQMVDFDYIDTNKMEIVEGRDFSREFPSDMERAYIINEEAIRRWDFESPVDRRFALNAAQGIIIGVFKNQHFGLKHDVMPKVLYLTSKTDWDRFNYLVVRLKGSHIPEALEDIKKIWKIHIPDSPIEYHFVDDMIDELYQSEERMSKLINTFTLLAIVVSCLGLFGMASFMAQQRTKEIGIRKVLGASVSRIIVLLTKEFAKLVLVANVIAWPVAFYMMQTWLNDYPYRIKIGFEIFLTAGASALFIALFTVIYQAVRAAVANPSDSLKYE
ncbi:MAG: ABC transporter permease [Candidatus Aminicenantes bacterium]|nr:ABC transporter permease [Candidatus Aminicenantes bacterium]